MATTAAKLERNIANPDLHFRQKTSRYVEKLLRGVHKFR